MDLSHVLSFYINRRLELPYHRYGMYLTGMMLFGVSCAIFSFLVGPNPWFAALGIGSLVILMVWHPYYYALSDKRRPVLRYDVMVLLFI